ncbi:Hypothetical Protein FCC1311_058922 [Hondaea fermentalgiana]|uniref:ER-bound oxygenase mpaB/mpaB'/Rubber oxygenase catalytic domain-containing protein n=1 Tax=Hondaea fermentalgiana TaxID=2315210 RepID=A0A2R5GMY9_9STRA|nr:Hypothetical Protein FCC1311_058922 [Hondaea fermentalgiana]|eukprot:GBG29671.1 Hypothetical Protein FCC1311_058922 [Hondaea fermentalgiana]
MQHDLEYAAKVMALDRIPAKEELRYTTRFSQERFEAWRTMGDPAADECIRALVEINGRITNMSDLLKEVKEHRADSAACEAFLQEAWTVPAWMDFDKIKRGQELIAVYSPFMAVSLFSALVGGAMFRKAAIVTSMGQLGGPNSSRRVQETSFMIGKMVLPGELEPGGEAHDTLVRTRLLHAALRHHLSATGKFKHPTEQAINQHDLAITLGLFGYVNLRSLRHVGISLSTSDTASFMLMWKYAGYLLGIEADLLPDSLLDQQEFFMASMLDQAKPMGSGPREILDGVAEKAASESGFSVTLLQRYLYQLAQYMTGNDYMSGTGIEDEGPFYWGRALTYASGTLTNVVDQYVPFGTQALYAWNIKRMQRSFRNKELKESGYRAKL